MFLTINLGLIIAALLPVLTGWASNPTGFVRRPLEGVPLALVLLGCASLAWSVRDGFAVRRLHASAPRSA